MLLDHEGEQEQEFEEANEVQSTPVPDHAGGVTQDRQSIRDSALEDAGQEASRTSAIDDLVSKEGEITIEDLKKLPGSEGMTDEQLKAEWDKAVAAEKTGTGEQEVESAFKLPFPIYDKDGNKVEALEKISVRDLLEGKLQLSYQAMGKEQRKTLTEALRNASLGHWNEQKYNTTVEERNRVAQDLTKAQATLDQHTTERKVWDAALTALAMGNIEPMRQLAAAYQQNLTNVPQNTPGMVSVSSVEAERAEVAAGNQFIQETIIPAGVDIATRYGADPKEVLGAIEFFLKREPMQFLTREKIDSILKYDVPNVLEENGYTPKSQGSATGVKPAGQSNEVAELRKTVEALQSSIAEKKNNAVQSTRERSKKIPPSGGGATPGAGDSMPSFGSRSQMKAWMQGDKDWAKA